MPALADSHAHVLDPRLIEQSNEIIASLHQNGLAFFVEASASPEESKESIEFANAHENVYCTIGVHPHYCNDYNDEFERWALSLTAKQKHKVVAVGECGLDYHYPNSPPKELQQQVFARQIMIANAMKLPLVIHTRDAFCDTLKVLIENKQFIKHGIIFHCFSEGKLEVAQIREHFDAYFSFSCQITYKGTQRQAEAIHAIPHNRILVETDAPYLSPQHMRGKINFPANVKFAALHISDLLQIPFEEFAKITLENTKRIYKINTTV